jgi:hypothetical protein
MRRATEPLLLLLFLPMVLLVHLLLLSKNVCSGRELEANGGCMSTYHPTPTILTVHP